MNSYIEKQEEVFTDESVPAETTKNPSNLNTAVQKQQNLNLKVNQRL